MTRMKMCLWIAGNTDTDTDKYAEFSFLLLFWFLHDGLDIDRYVNMQGICLRTEKSLMTLPAPGQGT